MLVRSGTEGDWLPLRPIDGLPDGGVRAMCGSDVGAMLELDERLPVVAWGPWPVGAAAGVDAVCLTRDGGIELVVATHGESPRDTLWRIVDVASSLAGTTLETFIEHCTELDADGDIGSWLQRRCPHASEAAVEHLRAALDRGEFGIVLLTPDGAPALAQPLALLARGARRVRTFTLEVQRAGQVFAIDAELHAEHAPELVPPIAPPVEPARAQSVEPAPAPTVEPAAAPPVAPAVTATMELPPAELEPQVVASTEEAFLACVDRLDHRASANMRWLHEALRSLVDDVEYATDGEVVHVTGWCVGDRRRPLYGLDGDGLLQLVLATLPREEQAEFAGELASLLPDGLEGGDLLAAGIAELEVPVHLDDRTLLEYVVDNLVEAMPGGRARFGTDPAGDATAPGGDYFEGVSAGTDPDEFGDLADRAAA